MSWRSFTLAVLAALVASCATSAPPAVATCAEAAVPPDVVTEYYSIRGTSSAELRAEMTVRGPRDRRGLPRDALARWRVDWHYPFQRTASGCATGPSQVTVKTTYVLPQWSDQASASGELQRQWSCYLAAIVAHEDGHRAHGRDAAAQIEALLPTLPAQPTCAEMDALANAEGQRVLQQFRELDDEYDAKTRHGATQGAVFR